MAFRDLQSQWPQKCLMRSPLLNRSSITLCENSIWLYKKRESVNFQSILYCELIVKYFFTTGRTYVENYSSCSLWNNYLDLTEGKVFWRSDLLNSRMLQKIVSQNCFLSNLSEVLNDVLFWLPPWNWKFL